MANISEYFLWYYLKLRPFIRDTWLLSSMREKHDAHDDKIFECYRAGRKGSKSLIARLSWQFGLIPRSWRERRSSYSFRCIISRMGYTCSMREGAFKAALHRQWSAAEWRGVIATAITADTFHMRDVTATRCFAARFKFSVLADTLQLRTDKSNDCAKKRSPSPPGVLCTCTLTPTCANSPIFSRQIIRKLI